MSPIVNFLFLVIPLIHHLCPKITSLPPTIRLVFIPRCSVELHLGEEVEGEHGVDGHDDTHYDEGVGHWG